MSSISSVSSTTNAYQNTNQNKFGQFVQDFKAIGSALQSGDLSTAQSALATFQQDLQGNSQTSANQPFGKNTQANTDYQNLTTALQSGDLSVAQQSFSSLQTDLKAAHKGHHHHHSSNAVDSTSSSTTPTAASSSTVGTDGSLNATA